MFTVIKEFPNYQINENGIVMNIKFGWIMKPGTDTGKWGYKTKKLSLTKDNKRYTQRIHRLLAMTFIPNPNNLPEVDHIDNNSLNNTLSNLRWSSSSNNCQNRGFNKNNKLGIKNIGYDKKSNRYRFRKEVKGILIIKPFKTLDEAIECKAEWYRNNTSEFHKIN